MIRPIRRFLNLVSRFGKLTFSFLFEELFIFPIIVTLLVIVLGALLIHVSEVDSKLDKDPCHGADIRRFYEDISKCVATTGRGYEKCRKAVWVIKCDLPERGVQVQIPLGSDILDEGLGSDSDQK